MEFARPIDSGASIRPSFFDLLAKSNFESLLPPLFDPLLHTSSFKGRLIFYGVKTGVDLGLLAGFGGTASEVFYGLERTCKNKWLLYAVTLLESHIFPLLQHVKLSESFKKLVQVLDVLVKLAYICGDCKSFSLLHFISGINYRHARADVYERNDLSARLVRYFLISGQLVVYLVQSGLVEKLKLHFSQGESFNYKDSNNAIPSTPPDISFLTPNPHPKGHPAPQRAGLCPICLDSWNDPVILNSGFVYCRKCIKEDCKQCPVTLLKLTSVTPIFLN